MSDTVIAELKAEIAPAEGHWYQEAWYEDDEPRGNFRVVDIIDNGDRRWYRGETVVVQHMPSNDYYSFSQDIGLTENQDNEIYDNVTQVSRHVETRTIQEVKWKTVS